jgi:hypothetical protein
MPTYIVTTKATGAEVSRYAAAQVVPAGWPLDAFDHTELVDGAEPEVLDNPSDWYINVGPFYDRFGAFKLPILASTDPLVQAIIKDTSVRKYIDLKGRRTELAQAIGLLQSKGFAITTAAVLDVKPSAGEVFNG